MLKTILEAGTGTTAPPNSGLYMIIFYVVVIGGMMYFFFYLPQKKAKKKTAEMLESLAVGAMITTIGGVVGKIVNIADDEITIETGIENTKMKFKKWAIKEIV